MQLIDSGVLDPGEGVALDAVLFQSLEDRGTPEVLHLWESRHRAVVVGALGHVRREVHETACATDGVLIVRRASGGGAVLLDAGCLNYALLLSLDARPELRHVAHSYDVILRRIVAALNVPGLHLAGESDVALDDRKVSGNAQRRGRRALLHHGTVLYRFDTRTLDRYLAVPPRAPAYRRGRTHSSFVTNLPLDAVTIRAALAREWAPTAGHRADVVASLPGMCSNTLS